MEIYIDNEQVMCDKNLIIEEQLATSDSVILNNVYPITWENDKDYVSRFYMPKDYSNCLITNGALEQDWSLKNNIYTREDRKITNKITWNTGSKINYVRVIPGKTYKIRTCNYKQSGYMYEFNDLDIESAKINEWSVPNGFTWFTIVAEGNYIATTSYDGEKKVEIVDFKLHTTDNVLFSGYIKNSGNISLNPRHPHYATLQALDWSNLLSEGDLLNYVMPSMKVSDVLKHLIKDLKGFYIGTIEIDNDDTLATYNCNNKTPHDVLEYIAEVTSAIWYTKVLDDKVVSINLISPGQLEIESTIDYTQEYFIDNNIVDISYSYNAQDYRNKQIITNDEAVSDVEHVEVILYEGGNITTEYPVAKLVSVSNGPISYTVANKLSGENAHFIYDYGSNIVEVNSVNTGYLFTLTYYPIINLRQVAYNQDEIERITDVMSGVISRYEKRTDTNDAHALSQIAQSYIDYKSVPEVILSVKSYNKDLFTMGTQVLFNGPLDDLKTRYLVKSKKVEMIVIGNTEEIFYTYELSSSFNDENAINFFDNQRRKTEGNIEDDEYISRYIDIPSQTNIIFYGAKLTKIETIPENTLDAELEVEL